MKRTPNAPQVHAAPSAPDASGPPARRSWTRPEVIPAQIDLVTGGSASDPEGSFLSS